MKFYFAASIALVASVVFADDFEDAIAAVDSAEAANTPGMVDVNHFEYFDCWVEKALSIVPKERSRIGAIRDESMICGCYIVREKGGFGWRANDENKRIMKVWDFPKPRLLTCPNGACTMDTYVSQCSDYIKESTPMLSDFIEGGELQGAVALSFKSDSSLTPFGEYVEHRRSRIDSISCFFNVHDRPDVAYIADWRNPSIFHISGLPKKLIPSAIGRFTDYSDIRCLDSLTLTGFASNGYIENIRQVDSRGALHGEETGFMNDPTFPERQSSKWGSVLWTAKNKRGVRDGIAKFYRSSVYDNSDSTYYFRHLEVPYTQGFVNGTVKMYSDKNFLMAEIPYKRNALHGRMSVHNPFKGKDVTLTFKANNLDGFVDFGDFGGVYSNGLPNGVISFWTVKDSCYQWMPGQSVCYTKRIAKKQWGAYKKGVFKGKMECANGTKGGLDLICPELDSVSVAKVATNAAKEDSTKAILSSHSKHKKTAVKQTKKPIKKQKRKK